MTWSGKASSSPGRASTSAAPVSASPCAGAHRSPISARSDAFRRALLAAPTVAYADGGATGLHLQSILARLGIAEAMKPKLRPYPSGGAVQALARGEAELVVIGVSPILDVPGVELVGWLPPELQSYVVFTASIGAAARDADAARALLTALASPAAVELFKAHGFEPASLENAVSPICSAPNSM